MAEINVRATNAAQAAQGINQVTRAVDDAGRATDRANKKQYRPLAPGALSEMREYVRLLERAASLQHQAGGGGGGGSIGGGGHLAPTAPPTQSRSTGRGRGRWSNYGQNDGFGRLAGAFTGGVGGATSTIASEAMSGMRGPGGFSAMGMLRGSAIGAGLFAAFKLGSAVSEGYERAKDKAIDVDTLKRAMGDLGKSFSALQVAADRSAVGMGISTSEAVKLALEYNRLSGGLSGPDDMVRELRNSVGFARSYGLDHGQSGQFFASMRHLGGGDEQSSRRLALMIGETISRTGMNARAAELIQAIQSFASATNRMSLAAPNVEGYAGAFTGMMGLGIKGLTSDNAISILGAANQAMMSMGAAGEAGQNFTMAAFNRSGSRLNPIQAAVLAEGGMFGTRSGAFGAGSAYSTYMASQGVDVSGMAAGGGTNFEAVRAHLDTLGGGADLKLDAAKRFFGLSSYNQAAALMTMRPQKLGQLESLLGRNNIGVGDVNATGIATLGDLATAGGKDDLLRIYSSLKSRTGKGSLTSKEILSLDEASGGGTEEFRDALVKIAALKDQQETEGSKALQGMKAIETATTAAGEKLLAPMNTVRDAMVVAAGMGPGALREKAAKIEQDEINSEIDRRISAAQSDYLQGSGSNFGSAGAARSRRFLGAPGVDDAFVAEREAAEKKYLSEKSALEEERAKRLKGGAAQAEEKQAERTSMVEDRQALINAAAKAKGVDPRLLSAFPALENSGAHARSPKQALGEWQIMPGNFQKGLDATKFGDGAMMAATVLADAQRLYHGNKQAQVAYYNGGRAAGDAVAKGLPAPTAETRAYLERARKMGVFDDMPLPAGASAAGAAPQSAIVVVNGEFKLVDQAGRSVASSSSIQKQVSVPRGSGVANGR